MTKRTKIRLTQAVKNKINNDNLLTMYIDTGLYNMYSGEIKGMAGVSNSCVEDLLHNKVEVIEFIKNTVKYDRNDCLFRSIKFGKDKFHALNRGMLVTGDMMYKIISEYEPHKNEWIIPLLLDEYNIPCSSVLIESASNEYVLKYMVGVIKDRTPVNALQLFRRTISDSCPGFNTKDLIDDLVNWVADGTLVINTKYDQILCDAVDDDREDIIIWLCEHGHAKNIWAAINMAIIQHKRHLLDVLFAHL
jgi:hypothetical protein